ncbi:transcriptional regulator GcvA [Pararobbsia silviterrae]|uniref:Transcriptional regulator GcvA n=1 Tax=Pararobbsia silviterrae TaxID=1792498 RepID=A0A494YEI9_9BURK|nr:transcriptional regulator GcvA [Pararobbsia silviterrae]RKP58773.1 transcriptional regulator GcvA [Pararobbsia silviterrae]
MATSPRRLPNLNALRAFEAAARHESFSAAAEELFVTHSAISHQIRALETELGATLFQRSGRRVALTEIGQAYARQVSAAFANIAAATASIVRDHKTPRLVLSTIPSFAARWLAPRLGRFILANPEIDLELRSTTDIVDLEHADVDVAIRFGTGPYPDLHVEPLMSETFLVACSPTFNGGVFPRTPAELPSFTLLRSDYEHWRLWFDAAGLDGIQTPVRGAIYEDSSLLIEGAVEGLGIAMVRSSLAADALATGRLVPLFPEIVAPSPWRYWVVSSKANAERTPVARFREWVVAEARTFMAAQPGQPAASLPFAPETASLHAVLGQSEVQERSTAAPPAPHSGSSEHVSPRGHGRLRTTGLKSFPPLGQGEKTPTDRTTTRNQPRKKKQALE